MKRGTLLNPGKSLEQIKKRGKIPRHIAIIMDGNGRWAKKRGLPRVAGHREGVNSVRECVECCVEAGVEVLTLYTFSTENWRRPFEEVSALMKLLVQTLRKEINELNRNNIKLVVSGDLSGLPEETAKEMKEAVSMTRENTGLTVNIALNYGGREEIVEAVRQIANEVKAGRINPDTIQGETIQQRLYTANLPDPDLMIRTSGEFRLSNFLLWQLAYTEIVITDVLWPAFRKNELVKAIKNFAERERRFGKVSEQVQNISKDAPGNGPQ